MTENQKIIQRLEKQVDALKSSLIEENEKRLRMEGKLENYKNIENEAANASHRISEFKQERIHNLELEVSWLRRLIEFLTIPEDKLKAVQEFNNKFDPNIEGYYPRR